MKDHPDLDVPLAERIDRATAYLASAPPAIQGQGGDNHTYKVCAHVVNDLAVPRDDALPLLLEWNKRCDPPWEERDIDRKITAAYIYAKRSYGHAYQSLNLIYNYIDHRTGTTVYRKRRVPAGNGKKKSFFFEVPSDKGWTRSKGNIGTEIPHWLYVNATLLAERPQILFLVEGEKDCERMWGLDLPATTADGGTEWPIDLTRQLHDLGVREVICIPDNDAEGRAYMKNVARSCATYQPAHATEIIEAQAEPLRVKIVSLPGLADREDFSDWANRQPRTTLYDTLRRLVDQAPYFDPEAEDPADVWVRTKHYQIDPSKQRNIDMALQKLNVALSYNSFTHKISINGEPVRGDDDLDAVWLSIEPRFDFRPDLALFHKVVRHLAKKHTFHPVKDYLDSLKWDGVPRIDSWLTTYGGAKNLQLTRTYGAIFLIAAVRRIKKPGSKYDEIMVLIGLQGLGKSSAFRALCPDPAWFLDNFSLDMPPRELLELTEGKWIVEIADLVTSKRAIDRTKAMLSRQSDKSRKAYDRLTTEEDRQFIFCGTTNNRTFLKDATGGRRFWSVDIPRAFDLVGLIRDRDQLWAEAVVREAAGASIRLPEDLYAAAKIEQDRHLEDDPWIDALRDLVDLTGDYILIESTWEAVKLGGDRVAFRTRNHRDQLDDTMRRLGYEKDQTRGYDGESRWMWCRVGCEDTTSVTETETEAQREVELDFPFHLPDGTALKYHEISTRQRPKHPAVDPFTGEKLQSPPEAPKFGGRKPGRKDTD